MDARKTTIKKYFKCKSFAIIYVYFLTDRKSTNLAKLFYKKVTI